MTLLIFPSCIYQHVWITEQVYKAQVQRPWGVFPYLVVWRGRSRWVWSCCRSCWRTWCSQVWGRGGRCPVCGWSWLRRWSGACIWSPPSRSAQSPRRWSAQTARRPRSYNDTEDFVWAQQHKKILLLENVVIHASLDHCLKKCKVYNII